MVARSPAPLPNPQLVEAVLNILCQNKRPTGSTLIHERLLGQGFLLSEPTVGRLLRETDRAGYTRREGRLGRLMTTKGREHLRKLHDHASRDRNAKRLVDSLRAQTLADVRNVLVARRGIEREIARDAALRATDADVAALRRQAQRIRRGATTEGLHALLVRAAHNPILDSVYQLITQDPGVQRLLDRLTQEQGMLFDLPFDRRLSDAVARRDPDAAEAAMQVHLDAVLAMVEKLESRTAKKARRRAG